MKNAISTVALLAVVFVSGCAKAPPKCSDEDTFTLIKQIIAEQFGELKEISKEEIYSQMRIDLPRASAFDEKIKKYSCEAKLIVGESVELPITYESQLDDNNQHLVTVGGISSGDMLALKIAVAVGVQKALDSKNPPANPLPAKPQPEEASAVPTPQTPAETSSPAVAESNAAEPKSWKPSFDCAKASSYSEKAICGTTLLGSLDGALSENYKMMMASDIGDGAKADLKATQRKWMSERNICKDNECIIALYKKRIDEICEYPVLSGAHPNCTSSDDVK